MPYNTVGRDNQKTTSEPSTFSLTLRGGVITFISVHATLTRTLINVKFVNVKFVNMPPPSRNAIDKVKAGFLQVMADNYAFNKTSMSLVDIAKGIGYESNNNKSFKSAYKELKDEGIVTKPQGGIVDITEKGIKDHMPAPRPPPTNEEIQQDYLSKTVAMKTKDKDFPSEEKTTMIFNRLSDGQAHSKEELANMVGWANTNNKAIKKLMKFFKDKELIESATSTGTAIIKFTDTMFPNGRPELQFGQPTSGSINKRKADQITADDTDDE